MTMMQNRRGLRWTDRYPYINQLYELSETLPQSVQHSIGENLLALIHQYRDIIYQSSLKSFGGEAAMSFYKSKRKLRWYDAVLPLHKSFYMMLTLPEPALYHLNEKCQALVRYVNTYKPGRVVKPAKTVGASHQVDKPLHSAITIRNDEAYLSTAWDKPGKTS